MFVSGKNLRRDLTALLMASLVWVEGQRSVRGAEPPWEASISPPATYRILPRPLPEHVGKHLPYSTTHQPVAKPNYETHPTSPYSYGWFGPRSSPHWTRHFGYDRRYTQWSLK